MSLYCTLQGEITYPDDETFDNTVRKLVDGGWLENDAFVGEDGEQIGESQVSRSLRAIVLPFGLYRNLSGSILFPTGATGWLIGTTTDGTFEGWVIIDGEQRLTSLTEWAIQHMAAADQQGPSIDDFDAYCDWQQRVELAYHDQEMASNEIGD